MALGAFFIHRSLLRRDGIKANFGEKKDGKNYKKGQLQNNIKSNNLMMELEADDKDNREEFK